MNNIFSSVGIPSIPRSRFDMSHERKFDCDMGELIPVMAEICLPGDIWNIRNEIVVRMNPLVAPVLHEIFVYVHYFVAPIRLMWDDWEDFIAGQGEPESIPTVVPLSPDDVAQYTLWDYFGFPIGVSPDADNRPLQFAHYMYNWVWNEWYRDQNVQSEVSLVNMEVLYRNWEKDYFSSVLPWQVKGTAPALASGTTSAVWLASLDAGTPFNLTGDDNDFRPSSGGSTTVLNNNTVDLSLASGFDIADMRMAFQITRMLELDARAGSRYVELLKAHFGVPMMDYRLQRPELIGGTKAPILVSEVLQTSQTDTTPQGNLAGHGISVSTGYAGNYRCTEHCIIMGLMSIMPKPVYQQGIDKQWFAKTRYQWPWPALYHLSEQPVLRREIYLSGLKTENETVFGYRGIYDEFRYRRDTVHGAMATSLDYWHVSKQYGAAPVLSSAFLECNPRKDIFAVPSAKGFIVNFGNKLSAVRPLPVMAVPGFLDHI